jgi:hypothetical protein
MHVRFLVNIHFHSILSNFALAFFFVSVKPGVRVREVGDVISRHASMSGLSVVSGINQQPSYAIND